MSKEIQSPEETYAEVCSFLETYGGDNPFLLSVKAAFKRYGRISDKQMTAVWQNMNTEEAEDVEVNTANAKRVAEVICVMPGVGRATPSVPVGKFIFKANLERSAVNVVDATETYENRYKQVRPVFYATINRSDGSITWGGRTTTEQRTQVAAMINKAKLKA